MNTADKSLTQIDTALRRRFEFKEVMPDPAIVRDKVGDNGVIEGVDIAKMLEYMNTRIEVLYDREHTIGHSYFLEIKTLDDLNRVFSKEIIPLLQEYFFEDYKKIRAVLNDVKGVFVEEKKVSDTKKHPEYRCLEDKAFGLELDEDLNAFEVKPGPWEKSVFTKIYDDASEEAKTEETDGEGPAAGQDDAGVIVEDVE